MIRTIELILGLAPLSQFDAAARPMFASFTDKPDLTPYVPEPPRIDLNEVNAPTAYGADRSIKMDFDEYDRIDDFELNEILWRVDQGEGCTRAAGGPAGDRVPAEMKGLLVERHRTARPKPWSPARVSPLKPGLGGTGGPGMGTEPFIP